jgi:uncharacterized protein (DUF2126 family)
MDFEDVLAELRAAGYAFDVRLVRARTSSSASRWWRGGRTASRSSCAALEPWHVMGEEGAAGGTVRYVDSSVERMQVKVRAERQPPRPHLQRPPLPLQPTGTRGEFVAGVRYRAWQPAVGLHPTIGVHAPLVFDIVDTWMRRSLGRLPYHVAHPGGRNYETFPVNAYEAESRRLARFF